MPQTARNVGLVAALAMLLFSGWTYLQTGNWVALIFIFGSLGYLFVFLIASNRSGR